MRYCGILNPLTPHSEWHSITHSLTHSLAHSILINLFIKVTLLLPFLLSITFLQSAFYAYVWHILDGTSYAPINGNPVGGGGGEGVHAKDLMPATIPPVGLLIVQSDPGVGTFDFDRQKPGINSEAVTKSVPRGFLKVTLLEKGMKFSFVLIAIIRYFKLPSKQIMSILRKILSSSSHLIIKLD